MEEIPLKISKQPLFQRTNSDSSVELLERGPRCVSADHIDRRKRKVKQHRSKKIMRSLSASASESPNSKMNKLTAENIDLGNTPLSSLRSCSEYNRGNTAQYIPASLDNPMSSSFWSSLLFWRVTSTSPLQDIKAQRKTKQRVRFASHNSEQQNFLVEQLRFNEANLMEGEEYHYSAPPSQQVIQHPHTTPTCFSGRSSSTNSNHYSPAASSSSSSAESVSILRESSMAFDYIFGIKLQKEKLPMEIELKTLREPQYFEVDRSAEMEQTAAEAAAAANGSSTTTINPINMRRVTSFRSLERVVQAGDIAADHYQQQRVFVPPVIAFRLRDTGTWQPAALRVWQYTIERLRRRVGRDDESFYESIRLQPFSSGAYLRGMLLAGLSSMVFQIYNLITWPRSSVSLLPYQLAVHYLLLLSLLLQIALSLVQLPCRLRLHYLCWEASRAVEVDGAINFLRTMLQSDAWLFNRSVGQALDAIALFNLFITETYLAVTSFMHSNGDGFVLGLDDVGADPIRGLSVSLCATNLLTFVSRVAVATVYSLSMHDPQVLSEARRRGLSKWDLDVIPTFVFSSPEEVTNCDCSICLSSFDMGEMLISLPCDKKHSFHASCIRQWLQRQNSCPLCQKMV